MLRHLPVLACAGLLGAQRPAPADVDPARAFFAAGEVVRISITLSEADREHLRRKPREYVPATVQKDREPAWETAGVKLKGAAGSFRELDDRPCFTLHLGRFGEAHRLHGLQRFHLNNSVQDDSWLCEWLGHEVFTAAGLPAPRVAHALVTLDGRSLGLYVLREAFDRQFLLRVFGHTDGNLYDGGFCQDIDSDLEKDSGDGRDDHGDLQKLRELCRGGGSGGEHLEQLEAAIDMAAFVDFMALELMLDHWDGYTRNRNNFRLWCGSGQAGVRFLPHGMDQIYDADEEVSVLAHPTAIVASACHEEPALRKRYRERLRALLPLLDPQRIAPKLDAIAARLQKALRGFDDDAARSHAQAVRALQERVAARYRELQVQVRAPEPKPLQFPGSKPVALKTWHPAAESDHVVLAKKGFQGTNALQIACQRGPDAAREAVWRTQVLLGRGRYRLSATTRCEGIREPKPAGGEEPDGGVRLAVDGASSERLTGNQSWQPLVCEFEVGEFQRNVELQLRLRAVSGTAWFRTDSLQLTRLAD
ncbi:MAG TPA: CotH kinase family protein [Planctomycetota bacterium]